MLLILACSDRKSTRLNSSHLVISYAVFCLKKKIADNGARILLGLKQAGDQRRLKSSVHGRRNLVLDESNELRRQDVLMRAPFFFLIIRRPPRSKLFPYTSLFR